MRLSDKSNIRRITLVCAGLWLITGCDDRATRERIDDKQEAVGELTDKLQELEDEKEARIEQAAAEARKEEREEVESEIESTKEEIQQSRESLESLRQRKQVEQDLQQKLDRLKTRIEKLEPSAVVADDVSAPLTSAHEEVEHQLDELRVADAGDWADLRVEIEEAYEKLRQAVASAAAKTETTETQSADQGEGKE